MKRYFTGFAFAMTACFLITGCSVGGGSATAKNQLNTSFTTGVTMELEEMTAEGTMQRVGDGEWNVSFSEPAQLAGVRLDFLDGEVTASYKGLAFSVPQTALPAKSILYQFILAADQLAETSDLQGTSGEDGVTLKGELEAGNYELILLADGSPSVFQMENQNATILFHDFVSDGASLVTETSQASEETTVSNVQSDNMETEQTEITTETVS
ncbi:MAG: hypothetical protein Q4D37_10985 [Oscillospiraceae bacterium]|nr:hypothetical protein [Oscillospiraceae bacterium]